MNRFHKDHREAAREMAPALSILFLAAAAAGLFLEIGSISENSQEKQKALLADALNRSIVQCYALEGRYPESLSYLEKNYGLVYDKDKFFIDYEIVGANMKPEATVYDK